MKLTGVTKFVMGRKLYERSDGFYQDDRGYLFDYRNGKLYVQKQPGLWWLLRSGGLDADQYDQAMRDGNQAADDILDQAERGVENARKRAEKAYQSR